MRKLNRRTIMIFPQFNNIDEIECIREKYDPLFNHIKPHITLVFTFESDIIAKELKGHMMLVLKEIKPFELSMDKIEAVDNQLGRYLFLLPHKGTEYIKKISSVLYTGILEEYKPQWLNKDTYMPHMTIGCFDSKEQLDKAYEEVNAVNHRFIATINKVSAEIIDENEDSIVDIEVDLEY
ncbi:MAG: 2'-5' RNA ligase family protein [Romboutsia sp.]|nr:2'-5' RNA ligase family protein [Romboutsia sp.]